MEMTFEAVFENGLLRPLAPVALANHQHVQVTVVGLTGVSEDIAAYFEPEEWEASKLDDISLEEVRRAMSTIRGSLSDAIIASRDDRF